MHIKCMENTDPNKSYKEQLKVFITNSYMFIFLFLSIHLFEPVKSTFFYQWPKKPTFPTKTNGFLGFVCFHKICLMGLVHFLQFF